MALLWLTLHVFILTKNNMCLCVRYVGCCFCKSVTNYSVSVRQVRRLLRHGAPVAAWQHCPAPSAAARERCRTAAAAAPLPAAAAVTSAARALRAAAAGQCSLEAAAVTFSVIGLSLT